MATKAFMSYVQHDRTIADQLAHDVSASGVEVLRATELVAGDYWEPKLMEQLRGATHFLLLLSPAYVTSSWSQKELEAAAVQESEGHTRIIPALVQDTEIPLILRGRHYVDLRFDYQAGLERIIVALQAQAEQSDVSRASRLSLGFGILGVLVSLISVAASSISLSTLAVDNLRFLALPTVLVAGATTLIAVLSVYRPWRRTVPAQIVGQKIERAYIEALELSPLNPVGTREKCGA